MKISLFPTPNKVNGLAQGYLTRKGENWERVWYEIMKNPKICRHWKREKFEGMQGEVLKFFEKRRVFQSKIEKERFEDGFEES